MGEHEGTGLLAMIVRHTFAAQYRFTRCKLQELQSCGRLTGTYGGRYGPLTDELVSTINLYLDGVTWPDLSSSQPKVPQS